MEVVNNIKSYSDNVKISDIIIANLNIKISEKQELLEKSSLDERLDKIYSYLLSEIDSIQIEKKIKLPLKGFLDKNRTYVIAKKIER